MRPLAVLVLLVVPLAGCFEWGGGIKENRDSGDGDDADRAGCLPPGGVAAIETALKAWADAFGQVPMTVRIDGTMDGQDGSVLLSVDQPRRAILVELSGEYADGSDILLKSVGADYSFEQDGLQAYGRDENPVSQVTFEGLYQQFLADVGGDDGIEFIGDDSLDGTEHSCQTLEGVDTVHFADGESRLWVEAAAPHRPLKAIVRDGGDDFTMFITHETPTILVDRSGVRVPATLVLAASAGSDGSIQATVAAGSTWVEFQQVEWQLFDAVDGDAEDGLVYFEEQLASQEWPLDWDDDGEVDDLFGYVDRDGNGLVSDGDEVYWQTQPYTDIAFFDTWAGEPVDVQAA